MAGPSEDAGPPENSGAPERVQDMLDRMAESDPLYGVRFRRGEEIAEEQVEEIVERGDNIAEMHLSNGRTVTVNVRDEVEEVR